MPSAGTVTVDFAAEVAKFNAQLKQVQSSVAKLETGFATAARAVKGFLTAGLVVGAVTAIAKATAESEAAIAQLNSALKNAGSIAGLTSKQFQDFASQMQRVTTFTDEAVVGVESILLSFKGLSGQTVLRATQAILDLSTRLKIDLTSGAKLVGKALEDPVQGLSRLSRAGVVFSDSQKQIIKDLVATGQIAAAQGLVLKNLEERFGGAAVAARDTFGGALIGLKNAFHDLLEAKTGMPALTAAINGLADLLSRPEVKAGFDFLLTLLAKAATFGAQVASIFGAIVLKIRDLKNELGLAITQLTNPQLADTLGKLSGPRGFGKPQTLAPEPIIDPARQKFLADRAETEILFVDKAQAEITDIIKKHVADREAAEIESTKRLSALQTDMSKTRLEIAKDEMNEELAIMRQRFEGEQIIQQVKQQTADLAIGLLQQLGVKNKAFAAAAIVLEKALAIQRVLQANIVASELAFASQLIPGYPPSLAAAAAAKAAVLAQGRIQIALIAATGAIQLGNLFSSGGGGLGTPSNPVFTQPGGSAGPVQAPTTQGAVQVFINGVITKDVIDQLMDSLRDEFARDVVIISGDSAQARELTGP